MFKKILVLFAALALLVLAGCTKTPNVPLEPTPTIDIPDTTLPPPTAYAVSPADLFTREDAEALVGAELPFVLKLGPAQNNFQTQIYQTSETSWTSAFSIAVAEPASMQNDMTPKGYFWNTFGYAAGTQNISDVGNAAFIHEGVLHVLSGSFYLKLQGQKDETPLEQDALVSAAKMAIERLPVPEAPTE